MLITTKNISPYCIPGLDRNQKYDFTRKRHTIDQVAEIVCKELELSVAEIKAKTRKRPIPETRQIVGYICTKCMTVNHTSQSVGNFFGLDRTTILNGNKVVVNFLETDKKFQYKLMRILKVLDL